MPRKNPEDAVNREIYDATHGGGKPKAKDKYDIDEIIKQRIKAEEAAANRKWNERKGEPVPSGPAGGRNYIDDKHAQPDMRSLASNLVQPGGKSIASSVAKVKQAADDLRAAGRAQQEADSKRVHNKEQTSGQDHVERMRKART